MISQIPARTVGGAQIIEPNDQNVRIPNLLQPTCELPGRLGSLTATSGFTFGIAPVLGDSFFTSLGVTRGASLPVLNAAIMAMKAGLWRFHIRASIFKNFLPATSVAQIQLVDPPALQTMNLVDLMAEANVVHMNGIDFLVNLPIDGYQIGFQTDATGVGQSEVLNCSVIGNRLA